MSLVLELNGLCQHVTLFPVTLWSTKNLFQDLQGCQDQKNGKVDLYDHVYVLFSKDPCSEADDDQEQGWDKHSQQVVDNRSSKGNFNNNGLHFADNCFAHTNLV